MSIRLSCIAPVLNSHEVVRRQLLHFERIGLPDDTELILVDDGSCPPLWIDNGIGVDPKIGCDSIGWCGYPHVQLLSTGDKRPWTWPLARNMAARKAKGEYLLMFDIDHILTRDCIDFVRQSEAQRIHFLRHFGVLTENGELATDRSVLKSYGLPDQQRLRIESHQNTFAMKRSLFWDLGGYREDLIGKPYPQGEDSGFYKKWREYAETFDIQSVEGPSLYVFPNGRWCGDVDYDKYGLFHNLSRKSDQNPYWRKQCRDLQQS